MSWLLGFLLWNTLWVSSLGWDIINRAPHLSLSLPQPWRGVPRDWHKCPISLLLWWDGHVTVMMRQTKSGSFQRTTAKCQRAGGCCLPLLVSPFLQAQGTNSTQQQWIEQKLITHCPLHIGVFSTFKLQSWLQIVALFPKRGPGSQGSTVLWLKSRWD